MSNPFDQFDSSDSSANPFDQFDAGANPAAKKQNKGIAGDIVTDLKRGVQQLPGIATGIADIPIAAVTGQPYASKAADALGEATGFQPSKWAKDAQAEYSTGRQEAAANVDKVWEQNQTPFSDAAKGNFSGIGQVAKSYIDNPQQLVGSVAESLPSMFAGGIAGRAAMGIGARGVSAAAGGVGAELPGALTRFVGEKAAPVIAGSGGEGAVMAGQQMDQLTQAGADPRTAAGASLLTGVGGAVVGVMGGKFSQKIGVVDPDTAMAGGALRATTTEAQDQTIKGMVKEGAKRVAGGAASEGLFEELPQSVLEQTLSNLAQGKPWDEGVARSAVEGTLAGSLMGGAFNVMPPKQEAAPTVPPAQEEQGGPMLALPAPTYTGTTGEQVLAADVDRNNAVAKAQAEADALYAMRDEFEREKRRGFPGGVPTITTDPAPIQQRIDALMGINQDRLQGLARTNYEKALENAFNEQIGFAVGKDDKEIPITMGDYLRSKVAAADIDRKRQGNAPAPTADAGIAAPPVIPVVGPLSAAANLAVQSGAHAAAMAKQAIAQQASGPLSSVAEQATTTQPTAEVTLNAAKPEKVDQAPPQANDAQARPAAAPQAAGESKAAGTSGTTTGAIDLTGKDEQKLQWLLGHGRNGYKEAAIAELQRRGVQIGNLEQANTDAIATAESSNPDQKKADSETVPALNVANSANEQQAEAGLPASTATEAKQDKAPASKPKARNKIDPEKDSLFVAIAKAGGMDTDELLSNGIDSNDITFESAARVKKDGQLSKKRRMPLSFGFGLPLHKKGGMSFDAMREEMQQYGYMPQGATKNDAIDLFRQELAGEPVFTPQAIEQQQSQDQEEFDKMMQEEQDRIDAELAAQEIVEDESGFNDLSFDEQSLANDFAEFAFGESGKQDDNATRAGMRALGFTEEEINDELAKNSQSQRESEEIASRPGQEGGADRNGNRAQDAQARQRGGEEGFDLAGQTNTQAAEQFAQQKSAKDKEAADKKAADDKAKADAEANDFRLAGSDRAADVAIAGGQVGLFGANGQPTKSAEQSTAPDSNKQEEVKPAEDGKPDNKSDAVAEQKKSAIEGAGEKLDFARKYKVASMDKEYSDSELSSLPLSKIWPTDEIDAIDDPFIAAVAHAARAEIPAKPRVAYKVARWVEKIKTVRGLAQRIIDGSVTKDGFSAAMKAISGLDGFAAKVAMLEAIDRKHWGRIGNVREYPDAYSYGENGEKVPSPSVLIDIDGKFKRFDGAKSVADIIERIPESLGDGAQAKKMQFDVRGRSGSFSINKKGDKEYRKLKTFSSAKEAFEFIKDNYDDLVAAWEGIKEADNVKETDVRNKENRPRTAKDWRKGKDVGSQEFIDEFGFRATDFGNYVKQGKESKERQGMLNQAYDALMDLADIVGIPPKAISLNGTLALGFGLNGSGWASAHFQPGDLFINLTKTRGAGTFAHEWFHALDNYFARMRNGGNQKTMAEVGNSQEEYRRQNYVTYKPEPLYVHKTKRSTAVTRAELERYHANAPGSSYYDPANWHKDPTHPEGVRAEVESAFSDLVNVLNESPMAKRARMIDKSPNGYWSRIIERGARSFENYIITKMMEKGYNNDYLANVRPVDDFPRSKDRYPYLLPNEVAPIAESFDALFGTLQTKETDSGVMLYNIADDAFVPDRYDAKAFSDAVEKIVETGTVPRNDLTIGDTPEVFKALGAKARSMVMPGSVVNKATDPALRGHDVRIEDMKNLPALLADPVMVFDSQTEPGALVAMVEAKDKSGNPIIVAIHVDTKGQGFHAVNKVASVYGKEGIAEMQRWINSSLRYYNKKKASGWLRAVGLQLPEANTIKRLNKSVVTDGDIVKASISVTRNISPADKAIYGMAAEGKGAAEILKFIASASRNPFYRQLAKLLTKTGISPSITVGDGKGWKFNAGEGNKYAAGYDPKKNMISLFRPASAERNMLHELMHAASLKALSGNGMAAAQMNALYQHVKKSGKLKGMYGMSDVDEFIAEAFSNPKFQDQLKKVAAPQASAGKLSSAWNWFVRIVRGILGVTENEENALAQALEIGVDVMRENMKAGEADGGIRYNVVDEGWSVSEQAKEAVMRLAGRPMLDPADPFAAENARLREQDQSLWSKAKKQLRRYLAPGGLLPQSVFAEKIKRDSEFQAVEFDVRHLIGGLEQAVKADFGMAFDKLSKEQMRPITEALAGNVPASLPEATKTAAVAMRQYIDGMSTEYLKIIQEKIDAKMLKALESGKDADKAQAINDIELFEKIKGNIGRYVHRSYQAFDDPKWFEKVPALVLNDSRLYLKQGYMESGETDAKAAQLAEVTLHEILKNGTAYDSMESFIAESKLGAKDLSVLMRRKEVPAQIRALLGEYPDARLNFTKSATKMGRLIWNTRFLDRVRDIGMGSFFFEGKDRPPAATTQIAADGSEVYAPLNGLWTFPEIAQSFKDALGKEQMSDLYRAIVRANGLVKYGKTVLAPTTAMRNWQSAMFFSLANGHFDLTQMKKSISAFREQVSQKATGQDLKYLRHLKQLGVVYDTPYAGEMARLMEDARMDELLSSDKGDAVRWFRKANQLAQGFYTFGDDFWKIIGFENEKAGLMKAGLSLQEAETEAAKRIRDTYPTYSMVGRGVQWLSRFPLAGTFVSFPAEIIRTSANMLRTVASDLKSGNPKLRELGMKRAAGMALVSAAFWSLAALSKAMAGVDDDEEEAIRDLAPEWQKNSTFLFMGRDEKGNLRYFDMSFLDPYGYWKRPITAMLRDQPWEDSLSSGLRGMLEPFLGADISAKAIFEAVSNQKESGGKVYKEKDGAIDQAVDIADHLRKALQPGVVGNVERLVKASTDVRRSSGQPYSVEDELVALVGWRATTVEPKTALYYRSFEFTDSLAEARKTLTDTLRDANDVSPDDIKDAKDRAKAKQEQAFSEMQRLVSAAESAGMSKMQIVQTLRLSNISQANIASLMQGTTPDISITPQLAAKAVRQASQMRGPEFAAEVFDRYRQAMAS